MKLDFWKPRQDGYAVPDDEEGGDRSPNVKLVGEEEEALLPGSAVASAAKPDPPRKSPLWVWPLFTAAVRQRILVEP